MDSKQTYQRLQPIFDAIDKSVICQSVVDNGNNTYTFACKRTKWATIGHIVTIGLLDYIIIGVDFNVNITVSGASLPTVLTFDLYSGYFKHGTIRTVANEQNTIGLENDRLPLVYLRDTANDIIHLNIDDTVSVDADCELFFLTSCKYDDWTQSDADSKAILPMRAWVSEFIKSLSNSPYVQELTGTGNTSDYKIVGVSESQSGVDKNVFNEYLSGVRLRITVPFLKECDCCDLTPKDRRPAPGYVFDNLGNVLAILYSNDTYTVIPSGGDVEIIDQDSNVIATISAPGQYQVTVFDGVVDTIDNNVTTILDNII